MVSQNDYLRTDILQRSRFCCVTCLLWLSASWVSGQPYGGHAGRVALPYSQPMRMERVARLGSPVAPVDAPDSQPSPSIHSFPRGAFDAPHQPAPPFDLVSSRMTPAANAPLDSLSSLRRAPGDMGVSMLGVPAFPSTVSTWNPNNGAPVVAPITAWDNDFSPTPIPADALTHNAFENRRPYDGKKPVPVQRPIVELGRPFYLSGLLPRGNEIFGRTNLTTPHFYVYGDYRNGYGGGENAGGEFHNIAYQLRLDADLGITSTERFHAFFQPLDRGGNFTGINLANRGDEFQEFLNGDVITAFFEGDLGMMLGGAKDIYSPFDLPVTAGLIPLIYQNGIWMEDAVTGAAFALPSKNSKQLVWSNFDATFFAAFDQLNTDAIPGDNHAAQVYGTAWFIEAYEGYIESGYAYINDRFDPTRSYHNATISFARRYFWKVSNAIRVIANTGQDRVRDQRTADGVLLIVENAFTSHDNLRFVPYLNFFAGFGRPPVGRSCWRSGWHSAQHGNQLRIG